MDTLLKPARLNLDPNSPSAAKEWKHWHRTFINFIDECGERAPNKFRTLVNYVSHDVYDYIEDCADYDAAIETLTHLYIKTPNEIFARHLLSTRRQKPGETLTEFLQELRKLSKDCNLKNVTAEQYREELIRDSFINGIASPLIRQRLLENTQLGLRAAFDQANSLDLAQKNSEAYAMPTIPVTAAVPSSSTDRHTEVPMPNDHSLAATNAPKKKCYFCGDPIHNRRSCPARNSVCNNCGKKGHYGKVCMSKATSSTTASLFSPTICSITAACPNRLSHASVNVSVYGNTLSALIDSGSSDSFISQTVAEQLNLKIHPSTQDIIMALTSLKTPIIGHCFADIDLNQRVYKSTRLGVLKDLCSDIILGHDFQKEHERVTIEFGGRKPELIIPNSAPICAISAATIDEPSLFSNLLPEPIASKSMRFSKDDQDFIQQEVTKLLSEDIIEISSSPWRAQAVVAKYPLNRHKERLCIDYSQTINQYTDLDAYPLPRIDDMVNNLAAYKVYSTFDLKSAYHQVPIKESDRKYTGFEANGRLYQFCRIPLV